MPQDSRLHIGTSGYQYDHWRGVFYPDDLPKKRWFERYAEVFDCVEINNTFYNLPEAKTFDAWRERTPPGFRYALKFSRYATHMKKLKDPEPIVRRFVEHAERLKGFLGPILVQLPPHWNVDLGRLDSFLKTCPDRLRWAIEFRDRSWLCDRVFDLLRQYHVALCIHDLIDDHPRILTADWIYLRFHGVDYSHPYSPQALTARARSIQSFLGQGIDVYAFFNNDAHGHAVRNAQDLERYVTSAA